MFLLLCSKHKTAYEMRISDWSSDVCSSDLAIFAGGCFWGVQVVFQHTKGVIEAVSGYAGGSAGTAHYDRVGGGDTGHAESVEVVFDPSKISYGTLLRIVFSVVHNPNELNRQGPATGTQYRPALFPTSSSQRDEIERANV